MVQTGVLGPLLGAITLGLIHGLEPGHGWPAAASYALDRTNQWFYGFVSSFLLGVGHLVSSIAVVAVFFWAKSFFDLAQIGWMNYVAGGLLIILGIYEYQHDHDHDHEHEEDESVTGRRDETDEKCAHCYIHGRDCAHDFGSAHGGESHNVRQSHGHAHVSGPLARLKQLLPFVDRHTYEPSTDASDRSLWGLVSFAFVLGFAHEEEFQIIALCAGSGACLELMVAYGLAVLVGLVGITMVLIAGYHRYEARVEQYAEYFPTVSAVVLVGMGIGFIIGFF